MKIGVYKLLLVFLMLMGIFVASGIEARQGCCSHHGGVCGCRCCDGTSLSAKCAPYYPQCNSNPEPVIPTLPIAKELTAQGSDEEKNDSILIWIAGIGVFSYIFYQLGKRFKDR